MVGLSFAIALPGRATAQDDFTHDATRLVRALELDTGKTVADIGAGAGQLTVLLARAVGPTGRAYATELEEGRLDAIRRAADSAGLGNVTVLEAHATRTNLPVGCCDALVVRFVYHHFQDPGLMNASLRESLKPGGLLAVIDFPPTGQESADPTKRNDGEQHGVTAATVIRELRQAGLELVAEEQGTPTTGFLVVVRRPAYPSPPAFPLRFNSSSSAATSSSSDMSENDRLRSLRSKWRSSDRSIRTTVPITSSVRAAAAAPDASQTNARHSRPRESVILRTSLMLNPPEARTSDDATGGPYRQGSLLPAGERRQGL
jgi:predicted methyltransferase